MFFKHWPVLLVDDEPDVLSISKLAMKNFTVYGLPLKIYTAASKAEAIALMNDNVEVGCSLAVAFLDVVMETDSAGLELCDYIRNTMGNSLTQVFVRTGQPGLAPEREVIDKYDINGYFTKMEATENKLYSLIKSSVRQYLAYGMATDTLELITQLVVATGSRRRISYALTSVCGTGFDQTDTPRWIIIDGVLLFPPDETDAEKTMTILLKMLMAREGLNLSPEGDKYVRDEVSGCQLIHICSTASKSEVSFLFSSHFAPPHKIVELMYSFTTALAIAWHKSEES
ncbi:response regulator [Crenothrix polyspora]|uniref:Response regulator receiver domain protein n=1 Tax=Crenothrix polyspora TaxID=360316 RepID=A0A1R4HHL9_9GAMM|nr:response regulator [Crenothrix polyspora]SJM95380.1 Response regulator receiver domain protein [Crenothrix polyspora]